MEEEREEEGVAVQIAASTFLSQGDREPHVSCRTDIFRNKNTQPFTCFGVHNGSPFSSKGCSTVVYEIEWRNSGEVREEQGFCECGVRVP